MATPTPILYDFALAFNPAKARLALVEKGIPFTTVPINIFNGQSLEPAYLKLNPNGSAPTLVHGDRVITESKEIITYVDSLGEPLGGANVDRAFIAQWLNQVDAWDGNHFFVWGSPSAAKLMAKLAHHKEGFAEARAKQYPDMAQVYSNKIASMQKQGQDYQDPANIEANKQGLHGLLTTAEQRLSTSPFLAGDSYSMADVIVTPVLFRLHNLKKQHEYLANRPKVTEYWQRLKQRPSYKKVFGAVESPLTAAKLLLPALARVSWSNITGRF